VGPGAGLDRCGKSRPTGVRSPDLPVRSESLYRLRYPGSPSYAVRKEITFYQLHYLDIIHNLCFVPNLMSFTRVHMQLPHRGNLSGLSKYRFRLGRKKICER
jgi:hypothetical protein